MEALGTGILGGAKPVEAHFGQPAFPQPDVLYPLALANQFVGRDLRTSLPDIEMVLSSTMNWDRSTDGSVASTAQSMLSVAVHAMGHGLGHTSWVRQTAVGRSDAPTSYLQSLLRISSSVFFLNKKQP